MTKHDLIKFINDNDISLGVASALTEIRFINDSIGYGRYAKEDILIDTIIYNAGGIWLTQEEKDRYTKDYFLYSSGQFYFQGSFNPYHNGSHNHSCDPNCYFEDFTIKAMRDIKKDEQLTIDYSSFINHNEIIIRECKCNSINCREIVTGKDWLIYDLPGKYNYRVSSEILRHYLNIQKGARS